MLDCSLLSLLWLSSPSLPVGAFAFSQGLEQLIEGGHLQGPEDLEEYLKDELELSFAYWDLPMLKRMHEAVLNEDRAKFAELDDWFKAGRETCELCDEERLIGSALMSLMRKLEVLPAGFASLQVGQTAAWALFASCVPQKMGSTPPKSEDVLEAYAFALMQGAVVCACKIMPLGQSTGQAILLRLIPGIKEACKRAMALEDADLGTALPLTMIASALHERQYSRLFRS